MRTHAKTSRRQQQSAPPIVAHIAPDWATGDCRALCGLPVRVTPADAPQDRYVVCALCEAAMMLDGMPDKPGTYSQLKLF